jgi:hypothetical protein
MRKTAPRPSEGDEASPPPSRRAQTAAVVSKAVVRAAASLGLNNAALAEVLGVSPATASRLRDGSHLLAPDSKPYELALLLIRLFRGLDAMVGGEEEPARSWMGAPNRALRGVPAELVRSVTGLVETVAYVDSARARL